MSEQPADSGYATCQHHWVSAHQPDFPDGLYWIWRCSFCGHYNADELARSVAEIRAAALRDAADSRPAWEWALSGEHVPDDLRRIADDEANR